MRLGWRAIDHPDVSMGMMEGGEGKAWAHVCPFLHHCLADTQAHITTIVRWIA